MLRDYQIIIRDTAIDKIRCFGFVYLAMEVRTGKTLTSLSIAKEIGNAILFVTKKKAISSITDDAAKLGVAVDVINYEQLHNYNKDFDIIILDESHCLGQFPKPSQRTKLLKEMCKGKPIIYLSGTPNPESNAQIYHQLWVSSYSPFKEDNFYKWHKAYGVPHTKFFFNRQVADYSKTKDFWPEIDHYFIRFSQQDAGFDMPVVEHIIKLPMPQKVKAAIHLLKRDKLINTEDGGVVLADTAVKEMQKVHQLCGGTIKKEDGNAIVFDHSKAAYIKENFEGKRIAIFYKFVAEGAALKWMFASRFTESPEVFNEGLFDVFISQIQSGREGINLSTADCIVMYNIDFSAVSYWQSRARLQTKDRQKEAVVYWLMFDGGIEEKVYKVVQQKKDYTLKHFRNGLH